jgi:hypothetical protein
MWVRVTKVAFEGTLFRCRAFGLNFTLRILCEPSGLNSSLVSLNSQLDLKRKVDRNLKSSQNIRTLYTKICTQQIEICDFRR